MINRELIEYFAEIAREKNVDRSELGSILEQLFMYIVEKERGDNSNCDVIVNIDKGEIEIYVEKEIVDDVEDPVLEILLEEANNAMPGENFEVGDVFVEIIDPTIFGRRMINTAKQFFNQRIQDVEKQHIYEDYSQRVGEIVIGVVHQVQRDERGHAWRHGSSPQAGPSSEWGRAVRRGGRGARKVHDQVCRSLLRTRRPGLGAGRSADVRRPDRGWRPGCKGSRAG